MNQATILAGVGECGLHKRTPYGIANVSQTQFSVARFAGGCTFNGDKYVYNAQTDELIRADVLKWKRKKERTPWPKNTEATP